MSPHNYKKKGEERLGLSAGFVNMEALGDRKDQYWHSSPLPDILYMK